MIIVVHNGWHSFADDGANLKVISAVSNIGQKYAFLYTTKSSATEYTYYLEIYKYGLRELETNNVECTVYYLV